VSGATAIQRQTVQRQDKVKPSPFDQLDPKLKEKLQASGFTRDSVTGMTNESINGMARVGAMLSDKDAAVWDLVKGVKGGWVTDNWAIGMEWTDENAVGDHCKDDPDWCKDSPHNPAHEGKVNAWRRVTRGSGPGLHLILDNARGHSDIHVDAHQPVKDKNKDGSCSLDIPDLLLKHGPDWIGAKGGGLAGARDTPVGRYSWARANIDGAAVSDEAKKQASAELDAIGDKVAMYASRGKLVEGLLSEGDKAMQGDKETMDHLNKAIDLLRPKMNMPPPGKPWW
jgi:hypothetical protein